MQDNRKWKERFGVSTAGNDFARLKKVN